MGIIALPEKNKNWNNPALVDKWSHTVNRVWKHATIYTLAITSSSSKDQHVQGGVSLIVTNKWASRVIYHGSDELGIWVWIKVEGRHNQILTVMVMYISQKGTPHDGKVESFWTQQYQHLLNEKLSKESLSPIAYPRD